MKPILKWAGGKTWLIPEVKAIWDAHPDRQLIEPFCGGLAIALGLAPQRAILNDTNPHLINLYQHIKRNAMKPRLFLLQNDSETYYWNRARFNELTKEVSTSLSLRKRAWLFYYLNRTGFNGLCRFNQEGGYNVPFGRYKKINYRTDFSDYTETFKNWEFYSGDFEGLTVPSDSFIYADPPYDGGFTKYAKDDFRWEDQERLVAWLVKQNVPAIASNLATDRILKLYEENGFTIRLLEAPRKISCNGNRKPVIEMLATLNLDNS